jgi:heme exporter protein C
MAAALALFAAINVPLVYKSVDIWEGIHPKTTVVPTLTGEMLVVFLFAFVLITILWALLLIVRLRLERAREELEALELEAEDLMEGHA